MAGKEKLMKPASYLDRRIEDFTIADDDLILDTDDFYMYDFPYEKEIHEGDYFALIVEAKAVKKTHEVTHYDIYYKMIRYNDWRSWNEEYIDSVPFYRMIQRYKIDSQPEKKFRAVMVEKLEGGRFQLSKLIGLTDAFYLQYTSNTNLGSIGKRYSKDIDADFFDIPESNS